MAGPAFAFGGGLYSLVVPEQNQRLPRPRAGTTGQWLHVPYSSRNIWVTDSGRLETHWQPQIVIPDAATYAIFDGLYDRFALLITPWHSSGIQARLDAFDVVPYEDGSFMGAVGWSWS